MYISIQAEQIIFDILFAFLIESGSAGQCGEMDHRPKWITDSGARKKK